MEIGTGLGVYITDNILNTIYVPSLSALKAMTWHSVKSRLVSAFNESLKELGRKYNIRLYWVSGHCEVESNKGADDLIKSVSNSGTI